MRPESRSSVKGLLKKGLKAEYFFGLLIGGAIFGLSEEVARTLQSPSMSVGDTVKCTQLLIQKFKNMRTDEEFEVQYNCL